MQRDNPGKWAVQFGERLQRLRHNLSAFQPIGSERLRDLAELPGTGRMRADRRSESLDRLHGQYDSRTVFSVAGKFIERAGIRGREYYADTKNGPSCDYYHEQ